MSWLSAGSYRSLSPSDCGWGSVTPRNVFLTFDDGYEDFYSTAFPVLNRLGLNATVFIVVGEIGGTNVWDQQKGLSSRKLLSKTQIMELHRMGVSFGSHSLTHRWLPELSDNDIYQEVVESKVLLEDLLGSEVNCFAYPYGGVDIRVKKAVARAGYKFAMGIREGLAVGEDRLCLNRIGISEADRFIDFRLKVLTGRSVRQRIVTRFVQYLRASLDGSPSIIARPLKAITGRVRDAINARAAGYE